MMPLFGLAGNMGAGKSTVAKILTEKYGFLEIAQATPLKTLAKRLFGFDDQALYGPTEERNKPQLAGLWEAPDFFSKLDIFAALCETNILPVNDERSDRILQICTKGVGLIETFYSEHKYLTARYVLQIIGTEIGRQIKNTLWTDIAVNQCIHHLSTCNTIQAAVISDVRFRSEILTIQSSGGWIVQVLDPSIYNDINKHSSEAELRGVPTFWFDTILYNDKRFGIESLEYKIDSIIDSYGIKKVCE